MSIATTVRGHLLIATIGILFFLISPTIANITKISAFAFVGVGALIASGWLLILHTIGLILSIGHRLSLARRAVLYSVIFGLFIISVTIAFRLSIASLPYSPSLLVVIILLSFLIYGDFRKYPPAPAAGKYSPVDIYLAKLLQK